MIVTQNLQKWGNGTGIRLPKKVVLAAKLQINQPLEISLQGDQILLKPVRQKVKPTLDDILEGVKPSDIGGEFWPGDEGKEIVE